MNLADVVVGDESDLPGNPETARAALREAVTPAPTETVPPAAAPAASPAPAANEDLPEKFRGKGIKDVVEMYQNLESRLGTMANDLGVQRQLTDRLLDLKRDTDLRSNTPPAPAREPVTSADLLDRPQETLERVVQERVKPVTDDVNARLSRMEAALAQSTFANRHSDFQTVVQDPKFISWVKASPIRLRAAAAANQGNWQIADELLTEFKGDARSAPPPPASPPGAPQADLEGARRGALETSGSSSAPDGASRGGKKTYRRADLMKLRITDPEAYYEESFQAEIGAAYAEGRVK